MNGLERITGRIEAEAKSEVDAILDAGKAEAQKAIDAWRERIDAETRELTAKGEKAALKRIDKINEAYQNN